MKCVVCQAAMVPDLLPDTFRCGACGQFSSTLPVRINEIDRIDEQARVVALKPIRLSNFEALLDQCASLIPAHGEILDVGCAHGWFLETAAARGYRCQGIEPDREMAAEAKGAGHDVVVGFFPDALPAGRQYDVITFNDVFEHLPDVDAMAQAVHARLKDGGLSIVNIPVSDGLIFRLARVAARAGVTGPLRRMWQEGLPSPHLNYFSQTTLRRLFERHGFALEKSGPLQSMAMKGLYRRIRYDRNINAVAAVALYGAALVVRLGLALFPSDIQYFVFRKR